eukprot:2154654-Prymnesium_polylepis.4
MPTAGVAPPRVCRNDEYAPRPEPSSSVEPSGARRSTTNAARPKSKSSPTGRTWFRQAWGREPRWGGSPVRGTSRRRARRGSCPSFASRHFMALVSASAASGMTQPVSCEVRHAGTC